MSSIAKSDCLGPHILRLLGIRDTNRVTGASIVMNANELVRVTVEYLAEKPQMIDGELVLPTELLEYEIKAFKIESKGDV